MASVVLSRALPACSALPILCAKTNNTARQSNPIGSNNEQQRTQHKTRSSPKLQRGEERALAVKTAAASWQHVPKLKSLMERNPTSNGSTAAAVLAKADSMAAVLQADLDADPATLDVLDILNMMMYDDSLAPAMQLYDDAVRLAMALAIVMDADLARDRVFKAQEAFSKRALGKNFGRRTGKGMFRRAPLVLRLLCSAVPGSNVFLMLPSNQRSFLAAQEFEYRLLDEPCLLEKALDNPAISFDDWHDFKPAEVDLPIKLALAAQGLSADCPVARHVRMANGSNLYIISAFEAASSIQRTVAGNSVPWAVLACDPFRKHNDCPNLMLAKTAVWDTFELYVDRKQEGVKEEDGKVYLKAVSRPCGVPELW